MKYDLLKFMLALALSAAANHESWAQPLRPSQDLHSGPPAAEAAPVPAKAELPVSCDRFRNGVVRFKPIVKFSDPQDGLTAVLKKLLVFQSFTDAEVVGCVTRHLEPSNPCPAGFSPFVKIGRQEIRLGEYCGNIPPEEEIFDSGIPYPLEPSQRYFLIDFDPSYQRIVDTTVQGWNGKEWRVIQDYEPFGAADTEYVTMARFAHDECFGKWARYDDIDIPYTTIEHTLPYPGATLVCRKS